MRQVVFGSTFVRIFISRGLSTQYARTFEVKKVRSKVPGKYEFVHQYKRAEKYGIRTVLKLLIYKCKRAFCTNVLLFLLYYTQEKKYYWILFHMKHKKLNNNTFPNK